MRFEVHQRFDAPAEEVIGLYCDPDLYPQLDGLGKLGRPELLSRDTDGDTVRLRVRYRFTAELPSAALAIVSPEKLTWVEETIFDLEELRSRTTIVPDHYPDRLAASAASSFTDVDDGSTREVTGELKVRALLVGGQVEKAIVSGMREHLADEAAVVSRLLR